MTSLETENAALTRIIEGLKGEIVSLKVALHKGRVANAATARKYILKESGLPQLSVDRLNQAFENSTDNAGLKQAINAERRMPATKQDARIDRILAGAK